MTISHSHQNHKAIWWDTNDRGRTIELSVIDYGIPHKSAHEILILNCYDVRLLIDELSKLLIDMDDRATEEVEGQEL